MKSRLFIFVSLMAMLFACHPIENPKVVHVTGVSLSPTELTLVEGDAAEITAVVTPSDASDKTVKWSSANPDVVYVREGKVMAISEGETNVTVTTTDGGFTAVCKVSVKRNTIHVQSITVAPSTLTLEEGETATLSATVAPVNADDKSFTWSVDKADVATVDATTGKVTAVKAGTATVTATTTDGGFKSTCTLTVEKIHPKSVSLNMTSNSVFKGDTFTLVATVSPEGADNKTVTWSSDKPSVATVDDNGLVTALAEGTAIITVTTADGGKTASCEVKVSIAHPESVSLNYATFTMSKGDELQLIATVLPEKAENKAVTWSTDNDKFASVDQNGLVKALAAGEVTISVVTEDGSLTASCVITILESGKFTGGNEGYDETDLN